MGIFDEAKEYGGTWTRKFDQSTDPFIAKHIVNVDLLYTGACAGFSLNWLEFKYEHPQNDYPEAYIEDPEQTFKIIEIQKYARFKDKPLAEVLTAMGPAKIGDNKEYLENKASLFAPGIKVISFKNAVSGNHVVVASCRYTSEGLVFELFDAMRGDVKFLINPSTMKNEKNPQTWIERYFSVYEAIGYTVEVSLYNNDWMNKENRDEIYETFKITNTIHEEREENPVRILKEEVESEPSIIYSLRQIFFAPKVNIQPASQEKNQNVSTQAESNTSQINTKTNTG